MASINSNRIDGAARKDFGVTRGRDFVHNFIIKDVDWSDNDFIATISTHSGSEIIINLDITDPVYVAGDTLFTMSIEGPVTTITPTPDMIGGCVKLYIDIERVDSDGRKSTLLFGDFIIY